jgi:predicted RNA binding protein YcfA (HicA-like mRNA interferase family)
LEAFTAVKVRDVLKRLKADGWFQARRRSSHRILKHATKTGTVVVAGKLSKDVGIGTLKSIWRQAELEDLP